MSSETRDGDRSTRYEGYSDYSAVSRSVADAVDRAVESYAMIHSRHSEGARVTPKMAAEAGHHILGAAVKLLPELEDDRETVDTYDEILTRWQGDDGFIERLKRENLSSRSPEFLGQMALDIRRAGFELGYLRAGRQGKTEPDDITERDSEEMFE